MAKECQCVMRQAFRSGTGEEVLATFAAGIVHPDWRVREVVAWGWSAGPVPPHPTARVAWAEQWDHHWTTLVADPNLAVQVAARQARMARATQQPGDGARATGRAAAALADWLATDPDAADPRNQPRTLRYRAASHPTVDESLLEDPVCDVRSRAVRTALAEPAGPDRIGTVLLDPCPEVRVNLLHQIRPPASPVPVNPTYAERRTWARAATDPGQLTMLAGRPDPRVRAAVAGNPATPAPVLVSLYHDPVLAVWTQAKDNPSWPSHVHLGDPFAERGLPWPRSTFHLARALIGTRTRLPGCCGRDAVVLATWGFLCPDHLEMARPVPADRYEGYLARRLITGVWTSTAADNPGPVDELWRSEPRLTVHMDQLPV